MAANKTTAGKKPSKPAAVAAKKPVAKKPVAKKPVAKKPVAKKPASHRINANAKETATKQGLPYVTVLSVELDANDVGNGAFELDWNDIFLARLVKAGYEGKDDAQIVDRWFQTICRNVLAENFEQWEANQNSSERVIQRRDLGNGRTETS